MTGKEGMGYGDFKLFAALGAWMGWKILPLVILLSAGAGAMLGISMILLRGRDRAAPMPFGPYLAAAGWLAMLYGESLIDGYLRLSGLQALAMAWPLRIGLTGGIASGKSTVAAAIRRARCGGDRRRRILALGGRARATGTRRGRPAIRQQRADRARVNWTAAPCARVIFADRAETADLEAILHPLIRADMERRAAHGGRSISGAVDTVARRGKARERVGAHRSDPRGRCGRNGANGAADEPRLHRRSMRPAPSSRRRRAAPSACAPRTTCWRMPAPSPNCDRRSMGCTRGTCARRQRADT